MDQILSRTAPRRRLGDRGFTLVEVMTAMAIGMIALTANLTLFTWAQKDFARSRTLTDATNEATAVLADFKTRTVNEINNTTDRVASGLRIGTHTETPALGNCKQIGGRTFCRTWEVWNLDVDGDGTADMVGDIVKIKVRVDWWLGVDTAAQNKHTITLATMTTGKPLS